MSDTPKSKFTAAIYARVSTKDKGQDTENQLIQLRDYCQRQGWTYLEYIDQASGKTDDRDAFKRLFADAARRMLDVVVVWALDRFTREGVLETFEYIRDLTRYGVQFESYTEAHFRATGMAGELMLAISAWIAKQERLRITERVNAALPEPGCTVPGPAPQLAARGLCSTETRSSSYAPPARAGPRWPQRSVWVLEPYAGLTSKACQNPSHGRLKSET